MSAELIVSHLRKQFLVGRPAVDDVSFRIAAGEIVVLLGPSGCGKTTTLRCIAGLEHPTGGTISIGGDEVAAPERGVHVPPRLAQHRHGVPVLRGLAAHDGAPERQLPAAPPQGPARSGQPQGRRGARPCRPDGIFRTSGDAAFRRADAARRACPRAGLRAAHPAARRAALEPRRQAAPAIARRTAPHHQGGEGHGALRHARPERGGGARRPHRRDGERQADADEPAGRALQQAGEPVRRELHRRVEPDQGRDRWRAGRGEACDRRSVARCARHAGQIRRCGARRRAPGEHSAAGERRRR